MHAHVENCRVRFHNSQQAAGKLAKLMGLEGEARDRDRDSTIRARVIAACVKLAKRWNRPLDEVIEEYLQTVPEHAKYLN